MVRGGFRHLVVVDGGETAGILSVRDIVRCWTDDGASCEIPQQPGRPARASAPARRASTPGGAARPELVAGGVVERELVRSPAARRGSTRSR